MDPVEALPTVPSDWAHYNDTDSKKPVAVEGLPEATSAKDVSQGVCPGRAGSSSTVAEASLSSWQSTMYLNSLIITSN